MAITVGGFEYEQLTDIEQWPSFVEWWEKEYGFKPLVIADRLDSKCKEVFEAYIAGAYWEWHRRVFPEKRQATASASALSQKIG